MKRTTQGTGPKNGDRPAHTWDPPERTTQTDPATGSTAAEATAAAPAHASGPAADSQPRGPRLLGRLEPRQVSTLTVLAVVIILVAAGAGLVGALAWPKTYAARAEVIFPLTQEQPTGFLREDRNLTTQLVLIAGRPVLAPVAAQTNRTVEDLQQHVTASVLQSSEIVEVQVTDRSPLRAQQTAQAVVDSYLRVNQTNEPLLRQRLDTELAAATTELTEAQGRLATQQAAVNGGTAGAATIAPLQSAVQTAQTRQQQLQSQLQAVNESTANPIAQLITPPYQAGVVSPSTAFAAMAGALVGLLLAVGVVAVLARSWTRE